MLGGRISLLTSGRGRLGGLNLAAVTCWQKHERLGVARLRRLAGTGMRTFRAVVLGWGIDGGAFFELVLAHAFHVVFHDLWRVGHALGVNDGSLHGEREPNGGCQRRCNKHTTVHDVFPLLVRPDAGTGGQSFALKAQKVTRLNQTFCGRRSPPPYNPPTPAHALPPLPPHARPSNPYT